MGATILCSPDGLVVTLPTGQRIPTFTAGETGQYLMTPQNEPIADIYWAALEPEEPTETGVFSFFLQWKPWFLTLKPYLPPTDPLRCTLFYDRKSDLVYLEAFASLAGQNWQIQSDYLIIGSEGVASQVSLTPSQMQW